MTSNRSQIKCISCSIFRNEIQLLQDHGAIDFPIHYLSSMLHLYPEKLKTQLEAQIAREEEQGHSVLLLYGDCHPDMHKQEAVPGVERIEGMNCPAILLGKDYYKRLQKEGVFFLMPEWTKRWLEVFQNNLGLSAEIAPEFMNEMHSRLVFLDTGITPVPKKHLKDISKYTNLPYEVLKVDLDNLKNSITKTLEKLGYAN